jgi:hypothetical protein
MIACIGTLGRYISFWYDGSNISLVQFTSEPLSEYSVVSFSFAHHLF